MKNRTSLPLRTLACRALLLMIVSGVTAAEPGMKPPKNERREIKEAAEAGEGKKVAADAGSRAMIKLREQLEITDDAEWELIAERIAKLTELRRTLAGTSGIRSAIVGDKVKPAGRTDRTARQEQDALRSAVRDKLPDAEIKSRLARAHEVHQQNEAKIQKAQEELRAVLTVRQEAVAVVAGLLPP
jgi:hypothetical protein